MTEDGGRRMTDTSREALRSDLTAALQRELMQMQRADKAEAKLAIAVTRIRALHEQLVSALRDAETLTAERDDLKAEQIDAIRAALEEAAKCCETLFVDAGNSAGREHGGALGCASEIRSIDPAAIAAKMKGDGDGVI